MCNREREREMGEGRNIPSHAEELEPVAMT
jgi:hypothetical protein